MKLQRVNMDVYGCRDFDDDHDVGSSHERVDDQSPSASSSPLPTQRMGPHCISLAPSTAFALTIVAKNLERTGRLHPGGTVLVLDDQMSSACIPSRPRVDGLGVHWKRCPGHGTIFLRGERTCVVARGQMTAAENSSVAAKRAIGARRRWLPSAFRSATGPTAPFLTSYGSPAPVAAGVT